VVTVDGSDAAKDGTLALLDSAVTQEAFEQGVKTVPKKIARLRSLNSKKSL
jgi:hypothetical protein